MAIANQKRVGPGMKILVNNSGKKEKKDSVLALAYAEQHSRM